jgi:hypothetical protein
MLRRSTSGRGALALGACLAAASCEGDEPFECASAACGGTLGDIVFVDEAGQPAAARGEYRSSTDSATRAPVPFDCSPADAGQRSLCDEGRLSPSVVFTQPDTRLALRFQLHDGSWSAWQALTLHFTSHTDPDFNGPGCPCTSYSATVGSVVVPADARLPAP